MKSIRRAYLEKRNKRYLNTNINLTEDNKDNNYNKKESRIFSQREQIDYKSHEENITRIEKLEKELKDLENENNKTIKEINSLKKFEKEQNNNFYKIDKEIKNEQKQLNKLKEINNSKSVEYNKLRNQHRELLIRQYRTLHSAVINELNRQALHRFFDRIRTRLRTGNNVSIPITNEQIQALPISYYPNRYNNTNQKCTICEFPYCYNDVIIKLRRCNHIFHKACLTNNLILTRASVCPICKMSLI